MKYEIKTAVGVVINNKNQILLGRCKTDDERDGLLCFPGGGIDGKEDVYTAALREVKEETNVIGTISRMTFLVHQEVPFIAFVLLKDTGDNSEIVWNDEYDPKNPGGWYDLDRLPSAEILNNNLDVMRTLGLITKPVYYHKNNESFQHLIESSESSTVAIDSILGRIEMPNIKEADYSKMKKFSLQVDMSEAGRSQMKILLEQIKAIGNIGHSFTIDVDPDSTEEEHRKKIGWDGDGQDMIYEIKDL